MEGSWWTFDRTSWRSSASSRWDIRKLFSRQSSIWRTLWVKLFYFYHRPEITRWFTPVAQHYNLEKENLQYLSMQVSTISTSLYKLLSYDPEMKLGTNILSDVTRALSKVKTLIGWLDRYPFQGKGCSGSWSLKSSNSKHLSQVTLNTARFEFRCWGMASSWQQSHSETDSWTMPSNEFWTWPKNYQSSLTTSSKISPTRCYSSRHIWTWLLWKSENLSWDSTSCRAINSFIGKSMTTCSWAHSNVLFFS